MADASRDVLIRVKLETQKGDDLRKQVEASVVKPVQGMKATLEASGAQVKAIRQDAEKTVEAVSAQRQAMNKKMEAFRRDNEIASLKSRKRSAEEEIQLMKLTAEKEAAFEAARERLKKIRISEKIAAFRRQKAEEVRIAQEAEARKVQAEAGKGGFFSEQKGRLARVGSAVVAAPAAFGAGVNFVNQLGDTLKAFGDRQALLNSQAYQAGKNFWEGVAQFGKFVFRLPQGRDANKPGGISIDGVPMAEVMQADEAKGLELTRQLNEIILQRTKAERDLLAAEKERIEQARTEFGLMTQPEQQAILGIAKKIQAGGVQALTGPELEQARAFQGFAGLIQEQAKAAAGAAGFGDILQATGAAGRMAGAAAKIATEVRNTFNFDLDPERLAEELEARLAPQLQKVQDQIFQNTLKQLQETEARIRAGQAVPAF